MPEDYSNIEINLDEPTTTTEDQNTNDDGDDNQDDGSNVDTKYDSIEVNVSEQQIGDNPNLSAGLETDIRSVDAPNRTGFNLDRFESELGGTADNQLNPNYQDLPKLRAEAQGFLRSAGSSLAKLPFQTAAQTIELAGYIGDVQAYDDAFRGLANYLSQKTSGEDIMSDDYSDLDNWLSEIGRAVNEDWDEMLPVYRKNPDKVWAPGDSAWWTENIGNLTETVAAFGGVSGAVRGGLGLLAKGATRGIGAGASVNTLRGGAKTSKYANYATTGGTALSTGYAEGMLVGMQNYEKVYNRKLQELKEEDDITNREAEKRAKEAAGQAAATTAGINSVVIPLLNLTGAATMVRGGRRTGNLTNRALERGSEEGFENVDQYLNRIDDTAAGTNAISKELGELARESGFESVEELSARFSEVEGENIVSEEEKPLSERMSEAFLTPQAALEATLGAFAGAGQQGIMRSLPTIEDPSGEGSISRRQLEWQRNAEWTNKEKKMLQEKIQNMKNAKDKLAEADEIQDDDPQRAQELRDEAMTAIRTEMTADSISRGVEHQLLGLYREIEAMDEEQASNLGFDTNEDSDQHYKRVAREEADKIEQYSDRYQELNDQYNFGTQEEFAGVPKTLLNLEIQRDNTDERIDNIDNLVSQLKDKSDEINSELEDAKSSQDAMENIELRKQAYNELAGFLQEIKDAGNADLTLSELIEGKDFEKAFEDFYDALAGEDSGVQQVDSKTKRRAERLVNFLSQLDNSFKNQVKNLKNIPVSQALTAISETQKRLDVELDAHRQTSNDAYTNFLNALNLEDNQENREFFEERRRGAQNDVQKQMRSLKQQKAREKEKKTAIDYEYNYMTSADGRQQLVNRTKSFLESQREDGINQMKSVIRNADSKEELRNISTNYPELITKEVDELIQERREEIDMNERRRKQEDAVDPKSEEAEQRAEDIANQTAEEVGRTEEEATEEDTGEEDGTFMDDLWNRMSGETETEDEAETEEEVTEEDTDTETEGVSQESLDTIRENLYDYVDNLKTDNDEAATEQIESFITILEGAEEISLTEDQKTRLLDQAMDRYRDNKSIMRTDDTTEDVDENIDRPPSNIDTRDDYDGSEDEVRYAGKRTIESGSSVVYKAIEYGVDRREQEVVRDSDGSVDRQATTQLRNLKDAVRLGDATEEDLENFRENNNIDTVITESKYSLTNERSDNLEDPTIESSRVLLPENNPELQYRVLSREEAEEENFSEADLATSRFREDIDNINQDNIDNAAIGIYRNDGTLIGYLHNPLSITPETTATNVENVSDNIKKQRAINRGIRKTVLKQLQQGNESIPATVKEKNPGHLTINFRRDEDGAPIEREFQSINEGFPDQNVDFFVIRQGELAGINLEKENVLNSEAYFENNEGSAGIIVTMGNGKKLAVPMWLPTLEEIDADGDNLVDSLYETILSGQRGEQIGNIDLSDPNALEKQLKKLVYISRSGIEDIRRREGRREVHVTVNDKGNVAVINQQTGEVYHTNDTAVRNMNYNKLSNNEERVKELLGKMRFNVDVHENNLNYRDNRFPEQLVTVDSEGNLTTEEFANYNDIIKKYAQTDIDASYSVTVDGAEEHLAYEQPTIVTEPDFERVPSKEVGNKNDASGETTSSKSTDTRSTKSEEETERSNESDVKGDTDDIRSTEPTDLEDSPAFIEEVTEPSEDQLRQLAYRIQNQEGDPVLTDAEETVYENNKETVDDMIDTIESANEENVTEDVMERYEEINTRASDNRSTDDLADSIRELKDLREELEAIGETYSEEGSLYEDIKNDIQDLEQILEMRADPDVDTDSSNEFDDFSDFDKQAGFTQDFEQNTYAGNTVIVRGIESGGPVDTDIIQTEIEQDIAQGRLNVKCKR